MDALSYRDTVDRASDYARRREFAVGCGLENAPDSSRQQVETRATFKTPGEYVLRCVAHDGALTATENVTVVVIP